MEFHADSSASAPTPAELLNTERQLISLYETRKSAGYATTDIEEAYDLVAKQLGAHGLFAEGLSKAASYPDTDTLWTTEGVKTGKGGNANRTQDSAGDMANEDEFEDDETGDDDDEVPLSKSFIAFQKASGYRPSFDPEGMRVVFKDWDAAQRKTAAKSGEAMPDGSFPIKTHGDLSDAVHLWKTGHQGPDPSKSKAHIVSRARALGAPDPFTSPVGKASGTDVNGKAQPRSTTKPDDNGPTPSSRDVDGDQGSYVPHPYKPSDAVASICATCGRPIADHVGKYLGIDHSFREAADQVAAYRLDIASTTVNKAVGPSSPSRHSREERAQGAQTGLALPDGSFYIPDEAALHEAIRLIAYAADPMQAMGHIIERGKAMGMEHALPPAWRVNDAGVEEPEPDGPGPGAHGIAPTPPTSPAPTKPPAAPKGAPKAPGGPYQGRQLPSAKVNKALGEAFKKLYDAGADTDTAISLIEQASSNTMEQFALHKSAGERFTLGPVYMPNQYDAHGEWATPEDLRKAAHDYVRETGGDRRVYLQHTDQPAGTWLEIMQWPFAQRAVMQKSINGVQKSFDVEFPAGTIYMGVEWEPWAFEAVNKELITGFSMGGWAQRLEMAITQMRP